MKTNHSHEGWIARARKGDEAAMYQLYGAYSDMVLNTAFRIVNNKPEAEDVLQDSFIKAFGNLHQFKQQSSFGSWVKRIAVNKSIDLIRRRKNDTSLDDIKPYQEPGEEPSSEALFGEEQLEEIYEAMHQLPDGYRTIFSLYVLEGYDHEEIAQILGIQVSTSISQLSRAKSKIRKLLPKTSGIKE